MKKILITGITGFLGSNIARTLVNLNYQVVGVKRRSGNLWRCKDFIHRITLINYDSLADTETELYRLKPDILIHAAWNGVKASGRENWIQQEKNINFLISLLEIAKNSGVARIISLGSQAEYGAFEGSVKEDFKCCPNNAYGAMKLCASELLKAYSVQNRIEWYWLRLFSVFGPGEDKNWLIPSTIYNLLDKKEMKLTPCEQKYDYLYVSDFVSGILKVIECQHNKSGIYNMATGESIELKKILSFLEERISPGLKLLQIGALPYRVNQVMNMQGNSDLFFQTFSFRPGFKIFDGLEETISYYESKKINE